MSIGESLLEDRISEGSLEEAELEPIKTWKWEENGEVISVCEKKKETENTRAVSKKII